MSKKPDIAWEVEATSGMAGTSIDANFLEGLSKKEIKYISKQISKINRECVEIMYKKGWL